MAEKRKDNDMEGLAERLEIRYVKLHFTLQFPEDTVLPQHKASALRGGMGEMLLRANCVRDRNCDACDFYSECIVHRTMYSRFDTVKPPFITTGDSSGYVLSCEDTRTVYQAGDLLRFNLTLFGKTIVYLNLFLQAFYAFGMLGIGKNKSRFRVLSVTSSKNVPLLDDSGNIYMENYQVSTVKEYVDYRRKTSGLAGKEKLYLLFRSPLTLKKDGAVLESFEMKPILESVYRRLYILDCFENLDLPMLSADGMELPEIVSQSIRSVAVPRYSSRSDTRMVFHGIRGETELKGVTEEILTVLLAGELLHIGKNTSFGFGRYLLKENV